MCCFFKENEFMQEQLIGFFADSSFTLLVDMQLFFQLSTKINVVKIIFHKFLFTRYFRYHFIKNEHDRILLVF